MNAVNQRNFASVADYRASLDEHPCKPAYRSDSIAPTESAAEYQQSTDLPTSAERLDNLARLNEEAVPTYVAPDVAPVVRTFSVDQLEWLVVCLSDAIAREQMRTQLSDQLGYRYFTEEAPHAA